MNILIACTQYPYYGGAATNSYALVKALRKRGHKVCGLFFENSNASCDPDAIGGIIKTQAGRESPSLLRKKIKAILGNKPDIILAKNYAAPIYCKKIFPKAKIIYLVSGSPLMMTLSKNNTSAVRYLKTSTDRIKKKFKKNLYTSSELSAIKCCDAIIVNSEISKKVFIKTYSDFLKNKKIFVPLDTSVLINNDPKKLRAFKDRNIDIAFVCSNFHRSVKNASFARKIFADKSLSNKRKLVIGDNNKMFQGIPGTLKRDKMKHKDIMRQLLRAKLVICPSYFDASPNIIKEAILSGCNILISKNCGWSERYPQNSVCADVYNIREWIINVDYLCKNKISYPNVNNKKKVLKSLEDLMIKVIKS